MYDLNVKMMNTDQNVRVSLRAMEPEDLDVLFEIENDERDWNVGVTNVPYSRSLLLDYIMNTSGDIYADKQVRLMIENEGKVTVGIVDLVNFSPTHLRAELGLVIKKEFRDRGYGASVVRKVCEYGRNVLHLHQIYAIVPKNNISCSKMLEDVGFQVNMVLKEWLFDGKSYADAQLFQIFF